MRITVFIFFLLLTAIAGSQDNQWRGPARDGHFPGTGLLKTWPEGGPEMILQVSGIGEGFSSPVEHNGIIYLTGLKDTMDMLTAIDPKGEILWQVPYGRSWTQSFPNTRSSPTLEDNRIYLLSGSGRLVCMDAEKGREIWSSDVDRDFKAVWHNWGIAETPLIVDDLVVCTPCGKRTAMVAFNKFTGELIWESESTGGRRSYVSPVLFRYNGIRLILGMSSWNLFAVDPESGEIVWQYPYYMLGEKQDERGAIFTNTPIFRGNEIFITTGYNYPSVMLELSQDAKSVSEKWRNKTLDNHHGHVVLVGDQIYGANWLDNRNGRWVCVDWETGKVMWEEKWNTKGSIITADDMLYIYEEKSGNVGLLKPDPAGFELSGTFRVTEGKGPYWAHPSISNGKLMIRHGDYLFVYNILE